MNQKLCGVLRNIGYSNAKSTKSSKINLKVEDKLVVHPKDIADFVKNCI